MGRRSTSVGHGRRFAPCLDNSVHDVLSEEGRHQRVLRVVHRGSCEGRGSALGGDDEGDRHASLVAHGDVGKVEALVARIVEEQRVRVGGCEREMSESVEQMQPSYDGLQYV